MKLVNLYSGANETVPYADLDKIVPAPAASLQVGDYVLLSDLYEDRRKGANYEEDANNNYPKPLLCKCLITKIVKSENFVQTSCGYFKEVPPTVFLTTPKLLKLRDAE